MAAIVTASVKLQLKSHNLIMRLSIKVDIAIKMMKMGKVRLLL